MHRHSARRRLLAYVGAVVLGAFVVGLRSLSSLREEPRGASAGALLRPSVDEQAIVEHIDSPLLVQPEHVALPVE